MKTKIYRQPISTGIEKICSHNVEWHLFENGLTICDMDIEYIQNNIIMNCVRGDLCTISPTGKEVLGWWSIQF